MQSVIVYRNPGEVAIWEFIMSANGFIFMCAVAVFFAVTVASENYLPYSVRRKVPYLSVILGVVAAGLTIWVM